MVDHSSIPLRPAPCADCIFMRDASSPEFNENYFVCGWWDDESRWPFIMAQPWIGGPPGEGIRAIPRARIDPETTEGEPAKCGQHQRK